MQILLLSLAALLVWAAPVVVARQAAATAPLSIRSTAQMPTAGNRQTVQGARGRLTEVRSRSIRAQPLRGEPYSSRDGTTARYPVELTGELVSIDRAREILRVRTNQGPQVVELFDETEYGLESGRAIRLSELRPGTEVRISGEERNGRILAHRLVVLDPAPYPQRADAPNTGSRGVIVGTVRTPTHLVSRKIKVRTPDGDVTVEAGQDTRITQYNERISVHELERGDRVQVEGVWTGDDRLRAARIDVALPESAGEATRGYRSTLPPASMPIRTVVGFLVSHDEDRDRMRLSTSGGDRIVVANGTPAYLDGERISRREIRQGDRVRVTGYWNGRELLATRVELAY
jgi:hypothetical protein